MTTGEIRPAPDLLGGVVYSNKSITTEILAEYREAYFRILWSFGGVYAGYRVIKKAGDVPSLEFFRELIGWHIDEWSRNIVGEPAIRKKIDDVMREESSDLHDTNSLLRLQELCDEFGTFDWPQDQRLRAG